MNPLITLAQNVPYALTSSRVAGRKFADTSTPSAPVHSDATLICLAFMSALASNRSSSPSRHDSPGGYALASATYSCDGGTCVSRALFTAVLVPVETGLAGLVLNRRGMRRIAPATPPSFLPLTDLR